MAKLDEVLDQYGGRDHWWSTLRGSNELDGYKKWCAEVGVPIRDGYEGLMEICKRQHEAGTNGPCSMLETRSFARRYGFGDDPEGFFDALGDKQ